MRFLRALGGALRLWPLLCMALCATSCIALPNTSAAMAPVLPEVQEALTYDVMMWAQILAPLTLL